jgi:hypothetical protein
LVAAVIRDHFDVLEGLFQFVKGDRQISKSYIHELHAALLQHQSTATAMDQFGRLFEAEVVKGRFKLRPNNPTRPDGTLHEYCPPEHVESEMDRLVEMHGEHVARGIPVEVESAWMHHRFAQIHPYQDGNGRVARALASLLFLKSGWFPLVVTRDDRGRYIDALETADEGDLRSLISFFVDVQKRALFQATQVASDLEPTQTVDQAIAAAKKVLGGPRRSLEPAVWRHTRATADYLMRIADGRLGEISNRLRDEIGSDRPEFSFNFNRGRSEYPTIASSDSTGAGYEHASSIEILADVRSLIELQARSIGSKFHGLIGVSVGLVHRDKVLIGQDDIFQTNYAESREDAEKRFRPWLEKSLARALTLWRQNLQ